MAMPRVRPLLLAGLIAGAALVLTAGPRAQAAPDRCVVPPSIRDPILNEVSGEQAFVHVQMLSANRDRQAEEYQNQYFETTYIRDLAVQAGLSDVQVDFFPSGDVWDGEEGDLWLVQPTREKIASLNQVPTSLAPGSRSADVEAEVVFVGQGREADYTGKDVKGKIVLGSGSLRTVFAGAVQRGAVGALGTGSPGISAQAAGASADQVGWVSISPAANTNGFGFALSQRQFLQLRDLIERGQKVVVKAHVRSKTYPGKMNVVSARIPGTDPGAGELAVVAHAFETIATPGANDNCTGVGTILEVGRTLARLIRDGGLPRPRRTIRFVWAPEISGTQAFMFKHPELQDTLLVALNFDMTGANTKTTDTYLRMKLTPDSRPSYINGLIGSLLTFVDQSEVRSPQGQNAPFNYRLSPVATISSGSDHSVFNDGGVPAMQFNYWPDNFYHSSGDRIVHVDSTELKRVAFVAASAMYYLATAGTPQAQDLAWEAATNGEKWIADVTRQAVRLIGNDPARLDEQRKSVQLKVSGAFLRSKGEVESVVSLSREAPVTASVKRFVAALEGARDLNARLVEDAYADRAATLGVKPGAVSLTDKEKEYSLLIPRRLFKAYSAEAQQRRGQRGAGGGAAGGGGGARGAAGAAGGPPPRRLPGLASSEVTNFIDGKRSVLEIYQAVRAECGNLIVGNDDTKFGYVLSAEAPDVDLDLVYAALESLQKNGTIEFVKVAPAAPARPARKK
jgi:aminopeptidase YwaD